MFLVLFTGFSNFDWIWTGHGFWHLAMKIRHNFRLLRVMKVINCTPFAGCREHLTNKNDFILSPYYPGHYPNDSWCKWRVTVPSGHVIQLEFLYFQLESEPQCLNDYVEVFDGKSTHSPSLGKFCGYTYPEKLKSSSAELLVVFKSNHRIVSAGFKAKYYAMRGKVFIIF